MVNIIAGFRKDTLYRIGGDIMTPEKWDPWKSLSFLQDRINRMFWEAFPEPRGEEDEVSLASWYPAVDIHENNEAIVLQAELPGLIRNHFF
jgi:HSP20 family protein